MSMQFSDTSTYKGLVQFYEKEIGAQRGDVTGSTDRLKEFAADVNQALDDFFALALTASGVWQLDDSNQTDYSIIKTNIVSGQRDYPFTTDGSGNLILDIYKVMILPNATATTYTELEKTDQQSEYSSIDSEITTTGTPYSYDKTANAIFLDPIPGYNVTSGLKVYINREASYFAYTDTTKKPGVPGLFHKYFYLKPAFEYARRNNLTNFAALQAEIQKLEGVDGENGAIQKYFARRAKDERPRITSRSINFR